MASDDEIREILENAVREVRGVLPNPESMALVISSPSLLTSSQDVNLILNRKSVV